MLSRLAYRRAKSEGVDVAPLLAKAGLTPAIIDDQNARVGVANQIKFVDLVAATLGDKNLGFHLAYEHDVRQIGLLYYVAASADTLGNALRRAERYVGVQNEGVKFKVSKGKSVRLDIEYAGVARHTDVQQIEFIIASMIRICRQLTGRNLNPTRVRLMHRLGDDKRKLERLLDCTIDDDFGADRIEFPAASWDLPLVSADPHLHRLCVQRCEEALAGRAKSASPLKVQVENAIAALLPHGQARHDLVATQLGMSPRTWRGDCRPRVRHSPRYWRTYGPLWRTAISRIVRCRFPKLPGCSVTPKSAHSRAPTSAGPECRPASHGRGSSGRSTGAFPSLDGGYWRQTTNFWQQTTRRRGRLSVMRPSPH